MALQIGIVGPKPLALARVQGSTPAVFIPFRAF